MSKDEELREAAAKLRLAMNVQRCLDGEVRRYTEKTQKEHDEQWEALRVSKYRIKRSNRF